MENETSLCGYKAVYMDGTKEYFMMGDLEKATLYCQKRLPMNSSVWLYRVINSDGFDAGHPLVFTATRFA